MRRFFAFAALVCAAVAAAALEVPYLSGRVNDLVGLLNEETRARLEQKLAGLEQATGAQMAVLIIPSLEGESLEDFSHRVASTWQLGQKGKDNGVLFLIAKNDRKMRLEVGYGLESVLTDATCRRILDNLVRPRFRAGDFAGGIEAGVEAVAKVIQGQALPEEAQKTRKEKPGGELGFFGTLFFLGIFLLVVGMFSLVALFASGCQSWFLYLFLLPFWTMFPMVLHPTVGLFTGIGWLVLFPVLKGLLFGTPWGAAFRKAHPGLVRMGTTRSRGGFWSGGGFSGGGFSGGGGSFGGGGASSSW
ncbi:MAG: hypothetical protein KatS3mg007_0761 [Thermoanaerobaculum sp.]|nr:MAG: hypothetical protein KatS3mg007_0761 [Thermoanaerobaculum sp.]